MNKRFFLALLLTGAVIVLTPLIFKGPPRAPVSDQTDSLPAPTVPGGTQVPPVASAAQPPSPIAVKLDTTARADTSTLITEKLRLRFVNTGAALVGAELPD